jgi:plastocyanin
MEPEGNAMEPVPPQPQRTVPVRIGRGAGVGLLLATTLVVAACGSGNKDNSASTSSTTTPSNPPAASSPSSPPAASSPSSVSLSAKGNQLLFDTNKLTASAGKVTINFTNGSALSHNVVVVNSANKVLGQTPTFDGGTKSFSANLKPGTYTYYCSVPGHRQAGMQGTLTVK